MKKVVIEKAQAKSTWKGGDHTSKKHEECVPVLVKVQLLLCQVVCPFDVASGRRFRNTPHLGTHEGVFALTLKRVSEPHPIPRAHYVYEYSMGPLSTHAAHATYTCSRTR